MDVLAAIGNTHFLGNRECAVDRKERTLRLAHSAAHCKVPRSAAQAEQKPGLAWLGLTPSQSRPRPIKPRRAFTHRLAVPTGVATGTLGEHRIQRNCSLAYRLDFSFGVLRFT